MIQDQSLFSIAAGATVKPNMVASTNFKSVNTLGQKGVVSVPQSSFRQNVAPMMSMK